MTRTPRRACWPSTRGARRARASFATSHPARLVAVALDRRAPVGGDAQLGSARLAQTVPRAVSMRQMSDETPPASGAPASARRRRPGPARAAPARTRPARRRHRRRVRGSGRRHQRGSPPRSAGPARAAPGCRRGDAERGAAAGDEAVEVIDLARLAARHVLRGRRELGRHRGGDAPSPRATAASGRRRPRPARARRPRAPPPPAARAPRQRGQLAVGCLGDRRRSRCRRSSPSAWTTARP